MSIKKKALVVYQGIKSSELVHLETKMIFSIAVVHDARTSFLLFSKKALYVDNVTRADQFLRSF